MGPPLVGVVQGVGPLQLLYEADALSNEEAIQLFSQYAFKQDVLEIDHVNLSDRMVKYA